MTMTGQPGTRTASTATCTRSKSSLSGEQEKALCIEGLFGLPDLYTLFRWQVERVTGLDVERLVEFRHIADWPVGSIFGR